MAPRVQLASLPLPCKRESALNLTVGSPTQQDAAANQSAGAAKPSGVRRKVSRKRSDASSVLSGSLLQQNAVWPNQSGTAAQPFGGHPLKRSAIAGKIQVNSQSQIDALEPKQDEVAAKPSGDCLRSRSATARNVRISSLSQRDAAGSNQSATSARTSEGRLRKRSATPGRAEGHRLQALFEHKSPLLLRSLPWRTSLPDHLHEKQSASVPSAKNSMNNARSVHNASAANAGQRLPLMLEEVGDVSEAADFSRVGMVRLVCQKVRDIRRQRPSHSHEAPQPLLKELGKDVQHSVRVCRKAKIFVEMAMEGVLKHHNTTAEDESNQEIVMTQADNQTPPSPISAKAISEWCELLNFLQAPTPQARRSRYGRSMSAASLGSETLLVCSGVTSSGYKRSSSTPFLASPKATK